MDVSFFQQVMNTSLLKKFTTTFPQLRKEKLEGKDLEEFLKNLDREGFLKAFKNSEQDPEELRQMFLKAFDEAVVVIKERLTKHSEEVVKVIREKQMEA